MTGFGTDTPDLRSSRIIAAVERGVTREARASGERVISEHELVT
jgi:hypothetical protein